MAGVPRAVDEMSAAESARLGGQSLTYSPVGATRTSTCPSGFHSVWYTVELGRGDAAFTRAADALMTWRMHLGAGLRVTASAGRVAEGAAVRCRLGPVRIPCRVVWIRDETDVRGFAYGTLPGHPESGEESFLVVRDHDVVRLEISAYSRPGNFAARLAGPLGRAFQRLMTRRYSAALRREVETLSPPTS
jgi:uncharacterized protein (UPF0548 family)